MNGLNFKLARNWSLFSCSLLPSFFLQPWRPRKGKVAAHETKLTRTLTAYSWCDLFFPETFFSHGLIALFLFGPEQTNERENLFFRGSLLCSTLLSAFYNLGCKPGFYLLLVPLSSHRVLDLYGLFYNLDLGHRVARITILLLSVLWHAFRKLAVTFSLSWSKQLQFIWKYRMYDVSEFVTLCLRKC